MAVPCNKQDFERFQQLANQLATSDPSAELKIYISTDRQVTSSNRGKVYTSLEITGHLSKEVVDQIYGIISKKLNVTTPA